jgi:hypothetical protein
MSNCCACGFYKSRIWKARHRGWRAPTGLDDGDGIQLMQPHDRACDGSSGYVNIIVSPDSTLAFIRRLSTRTCLTRSVVSSVRRLSGHFLNDKYREELVVGEVARHGMRRGRPNVGQDLQRHHIPLHDLYENEIA